MPDPLVIDTSAFAKPDFRQWLKTYYGYKIMPSITYAETLVHLLNQGGAAQTFNDLLGGLRITVESTDRAHAALAATHGHKHGDWGENARDYLIGAHAESPPRRLVTENVEDFSHLPRVVDVWDAVDDQF